MSKKGSRVHVKSSELILPDFTSNLKNMKMLNSIKGSSIKINKKDCYKKEDWDFPASIQDTKPSTVTEKKCKYVWIKHQIYKLIGLKFV